MMPTIDLVRRYISERGYRVLEDEDERTLRFRYQLNTVLVLTYPDDPQFVVLTLPGVDSVTDETRPQRLELCHTLTSTKKMVKAFISNDLIVLSAEFYFVAQDDFEPLFARALDMITAARGDYRKRVYDL